MTRLGAIKLLVAGVFADGYERSGGWIVDEETLKFLLTAWQAVCGWRDEERQ